MAKITREMRTQLERSLGRLNSKQCAELFIKMSNKQAKEMIDDFKNNFSIEALKEKWILD
jgi:hypothetical protein